MAGERNTMNAVANPEAMEGSCQPSEARSNSPCESKPNSRVEAEQSRECELEKGEEERQTDTTQAVAEQKTEDPYAGLGKRARRRAIKYEQWKERRTERRKLEKEKRKNKRKLANLERLREVDSNNNDNNNNNQDNGGVQKVSATGEADLENTNLQCGGERRPSKKRTREEFVGLAQQGYRVVIDCGFEEDLREKEKSSLVQQVMYCYAANRRAEKPCRLYLTSVRGSTEKRLKNISGFEDWPAVESTGKEYTETFEKEELVYLTADSPNVMENLDKDKVYIIGGIVDRNRLKNATKLKADEQQIQTARLPIQEHLKLYTTKVLTVNHVFDILVNYGQSGDWAEALLKAIPHRKKAQHKEGEGTLVDAHPPAEKKRKTQEPKRKSCGVAVQNETEAKEEGQVQHSGEQVQRPEDDQQRQEREQNQPGEHEQDKQEE